MNFFPHWRHTQRRDYDVWLRPVHCIQMNFFPHWRHTQRRDYDVFNWDLAVRNKISILNSYKSKRLSQLADGGKQKSPLKSSFKSSFAPFMHFRFSSSGGAVVVVVPLLAIWRRTSYRFLFIWRTIPTSSSSTRWLREADTSMYLQSRQLHTYFASDERTCKEMIL